MSPLTLGIYQVFLLLYRPSLSAMERRGSMEQENLQELTEAITAASPELDDDAPRVALATYRLLAEGAPLPLSRIAEATGHRAEDIEELIGSWPGVFRDPEGSIVGFWGLAIGPLNPEHRIEVDGRALWAWCAWDTLFLPDILGKEARITSTDPQTGERIRLTVGPDGVSEVSHEDAVLSFLIPDGSFSEKDVVSEFCHFIHFFGSRAAGERWVQEHPGTILLSLEEGFELGRMRNRARSFTLLD
jgi:alkylmercury lyase